MSNEQRTVAVGTLIASGGCVVKWLTQGVGDHRWLVFAFIIIAFGIAGFIWEGREK